VISVQQLLAATYGAINTMVDGGGKTYSLAVSGTAAAVGPLPAGRYRVHVQEGSAAAELTGRRTATSSTSGFPTDFSSGASGFAFRSDLVSVVDVDASLPYLQARLSTGTGTLWLVPVAPPT